MTDTPETPENPSHDQPSSEARPSWSTDLPQPGSSEGALEAAAGSSEGHTPQSAAEEPFIEPLPPAPLPKAEVPDIEFPPAPPVESTVPAEVLAPTASSALPPEARLAMPEPTPAEAEPTPVEAEATPAPSLPEPTGQPWIEDAPVTDLDEHEAHDAHEGHDHDHDHGHDHPHPRRISWSAVIQWVLIAVLAGVAASFAVLFTNKSSELDRQSKQTALALAESKSFAHDVTAYNYSTLDADFKKVLTHATGKFQKDFSDATVSTGQFVSLVKQYKATATSEVLQAGMISLKGSTASVLVVINQTVQNTNRPTPTATRQTGVVTLTRVGKVWKVSDFTIL